MLIKLAILSWIIVATTSTEPVKLQSLKAVHRFRNPNATDYYFICSIEGRYLQWQHNNDLLTGFNRNDVGRARVIFTTDLKYTATLLSSEPIGRDDRAMDSVLLVSIQNSANLNFSVTCSNGLANQTLDAKSITKVEGSVLSPDNDSFNVVVLEYVTTGHIRNTTSYIFMCSTQHLSQVFEVNNVPRIVFLSTNDVGTNMTVLVNPHVASMQGIIISRDPLTTLFVIRDDSDIYNVSCYFGNSVPARIQVNQASKSSEVKESDTTTKHFITTTRMDATNELKFTNSETMLTSRTTKHMKNNATTNEKNVTVWLAGGTILGGLGLVLSSAIISAAITVFLCIKRNRRVMEGRPYSISCTESVKLSMKRCGRQKQKQLSNENVGNAFNLSECVESCREDKEENASFRSCSMRRKERTYDRESKADRPVCNGNKRTLHLPIQEEGNQRILAANKFYILSQDAAGEVAANEVKQLRKWYCENSTHKTKISNREEFVLKTSGVAVRVGDFRRR